MDLAVKKPVIVFYRERQSQPERKAFAVVKAKELTISKDDEHGKIAGKISDFFPLMGDIDYVSSEAGISDRYVLCWFDDDVDDISEAWRRLSGVTFVSGLSLVTDMKGKRTYNAEFRAEHGIIE